MINIEELKPQIVEKLLPLKPDKIILFGSYAYGNPTKDSDIDLFLFKDMDKKLLRDYKVNLRKSISELVYKYKIGFDFLVASEDYVKNKEDYFYKEEIMKKGQVLYE